VNRTIAYRGRVFAEAAGHLQALPWTPVPPPPGASELLRPSTPEATSIRD
jgi:hypothetical protein